MSRRITKHGRYWALYDGEVLVCITVDTKGALEVLRRLQAVPPAPALREFTRVDQATRRHWR